MYSICKVEIFVQWCPNGILKLATLSGFYDGHKQMLQSGFHLLFFEYPWKDGENVNNADCTWKAAN